MSYVWGAQGVGFEYPPCWRIENRFLTLAGGLLLLGAVAVAWIALTKPGRSGTGVHLLGAAAMALLAVIDLVLVARQQRLHLAPGQPASLGYELSRQATGVAKDAQALRDLSSDGRWPPRELHGSWSHGLARLGGPVAHAPPALQEYLRMRLAHLVFAGAALGVFALTWAALAAAPGLALAALLYAALAAALAARSSWISRSAPGPWALGSTLVVLAGAGLGLALLGGRLEPVQDLRPLELPTAAALVLLLMALAEALGLLAARAQLTGPPVCKVTAPELAVDLSTEPGRLMQEVERELHRYWSEGVPNRRHVWEPPGPEDRASVLEESQPQPLPERADRDDGAARSRPWLMTLGALGLLLTLAGIGLWVTAVALHIEFHPLRWSPVASAAVLLVAGAYALRIGHLLWSRTEVESTLVAIDFGPAGAAAASNPERSLRLRARVTRLRSVFYLGAEHGLGSRTLLRAGSDEASAKRFVDQVRAFAERSRIDPGLAMRSPAMPTAPRPTPAAAPAAASPAPAAVRYCHACGTTLVAHARFCQNCGAAVRSG